MSSRPAFVALALATLFLGGLVGGVIGGALFSRPVAADPPRDVSPGTSATVPDPALLHAIEELTQELRRLGARRSDESPQRTPVGASEREPVDQAELIAALDRLTQMLQSAQGRVAPGGVGITPLILPPAGKREEALADLVGRGWEALSRDYRFLTYQQVLDRFGQPDELTSEGVWLYFLEDRDEQMTITFTFRFHDGYLTNIYD